MQMAARMSFMEPLPLPVNPLQAQLCYELCRRRLELKSSPSFFEAEIFPAFENTDKPFSVAFFSATPTEVAAFDKGNDEPWNFVGDQDGNTKQSKKLYKLDHFYTKPFCWTWMHFAVSTDFNKEYKGNFKFKFIKANLSMESVNLAKDHEAGVATATTYTDWSCDWSSIRLQRFAESSLWFPACAEIAPWRDQGVCIFVHDDGCGESLGETLVVAGRMIVWIIVWTLLNRFGLIICFGEHFVTCFEANLVTFLSGQKNGPFLWGSWRPWRNKEWKLWPCDAAAPTMWTSRRPKK